MKEMPRAGSKADKAIAFIEALGHARSDEIAKHLGLNIAQVESLLAKSVERLTLVACKVSSRGGPLQNEYRPAMSAPGAAPKGPNFRIKSGSTAAAMTAASVRGAAKSLSVRRASR